tara:strand:- start:9318 stop:9656 length:339 start_codon:yes stop_codon:yes gene_type:complete
MATYANIFIDQGSDFSFTVDLSTTVGLLDLTSYTARGQIRKSYTSTTAIDFNIDIDVPNKELNVSLTAAQTSSLKAGRYVYDIEILSSNSPAVVTRVVEGQLDATPRVTRGL